jgi:hypothetical protein
MDRLKLRRAPRRPAPNIRGARTAQGARAPRQIGARQPPPLSRITALALGRRLPGACGFVLTSVPSEQLNDHLGPQRVLPVGDKQPGGGLVHTALDEPCPQLVV